LKRNFWREIVNFTRGELYCTMRNIFRRCEALLETAGEHFESLLWSRASETAGQEHNLNCQHLHTLCTVNVPWQLSCSGYNNETSLWLVFVMGIRSRNDVSCDKPQEMEVQSWVLYNRRKICIFIGSLISWWW
jgi:hypothetical protein